MRRQRHAQLLLQLGGDGALRQQVGIWQVVQGSWHALRSGQRQKERQLQTRLFAPALDSSSPTCVSVSKSTVRSRARSRCFTMRSLAAMGLLQGGVRGKNK